MAMSGLRPELRLPEARPFLVSFLELLAYQRRRVQMHRKDVPGLTLLDYFVFAHIAVFEIVEMDGEGTRPADIINSLQAPRRTIRGALDRLERHGAIERTAAAGYVLTPIGVEITNAGFDGNWQRLGALCEAFVTLRTALGRDTP